MPIRRQKDNGTPIGVPLELCGTNTPVGPYCNNLISLDKI